MRGFIDEQSHLFSPEVIDNLVAALDEAWETAQADSVLAPALRNNSDAREILAKAIIESAADGERNPFRLREDALGNLTKTLIARATRSAASE